MTEFVKPTMWRILINDSDSDSDVINAFITLLPQINRLGRTQYYQHLNVGSIYIEVRKDT